MMRVCAVLLLLATTATAHICLLRPEQRGGYNISGPGEHDCVHPVAPCGGLPSQAPHSVHGGSLYDVVFQQNLNHYNPANPGFMDVAIFMGADPTSDDNFTTLAVLPDYWAHLQAAQSNFTVPVLLPNIDCEHCTLRVRYHPNKPTEPVFHNCADIKITKSAPTPQGFGELYSLATIPSVDRTGVAKLSLSEATDLATYLALEQGVELADGLVGVNVPQQLLYFLARTAPQTPPSTLLAADPHTGKTKAVQVSTPANVTWAALLSTDDTTTPLLLVGQKEVNDSAFSYEIFSVNTETGATASLGMSTPEPTYVNFLWADVDYKRNKAYVLGGDENSLWALNAAVFTFDLGAKTAKMVQQDNSAYTLGSIHVDPATGALLALSPGLFESDHAITLVSVDGDTGKVAAQHSVVPAGVFDAFYGGRVSHSSLAHYSTH